MSEPSADDRAREALTEQFNRKEPRASKDTYTQQEWADTFERPWVIPNKRYLADGGGDAYCRICIAPKKHEKLFAYRLHVAYEDDPMKVAKHGLIHVSCHNCGFDMYVPRSPKMRGADFKAMDEYAQLDPTRMQDMINRAMEQQERRRTAMEIERHMLAGMPVKAPPPMPPDLEKIRVEIAEAMRRQAELQGQVKYGVLSDPNKWPV